MVLGFHHAQITAPANSADRVRWYYGTLLGLTEIPPSPSMTRHGLIWFRLGPDRELHVAIEQGTDRLGTRAHIAYEVDDIVAYRQSIAAAGLPVIDQPVITGYDRFHTQDPFGNRVEIIGRVSTT